MATTIAPLVVPSRPMPLPVAPEFGRVASPATATHETAMSRSVAIRIRMLPPPQRAADTGVAVFDAISGAGFVWTPIAEANEMPDGSLLLRVMTRGSEDKTITLATSRGFARHGYLARAQFRPPQDDGADLDEIPLDAQATLVSFELPASARRAGPLRIVRLEDPHWLPLEHGTSGLLVTRAEPCRMLLGAGTYELRDPINPEHCQRFDVPTASAIVLSSILTVAQGDRP